MQIKCFDEILCLNIFLLLIQLTINFFHRKQIAHLQFIYFLVCNGTDKTNVTS
jgi:hypothetical protein